MSEERAARIRAKLWDCTWCGEMVALPIDDDPPDACGCGKGEWLEASVLTADAFCEYVKWTGIQLDHASDDTVRLLAEGLRIASNLYLGKEPPEHVPEPD